MASLSATEGEYDFVEKPSEDFCCPVTFDLLREPFLTACCGNHLSQEAVTRLQGQPCPVCKESNLSTMPDKYFKRRVNEFKIRCPNKSLGCEWVGELGSLDRHLSQNSVEGECQFVTVACPYSCGDSFQRCQLEGHKVNDCPNRPFTCQYCDHKTTYITVTNEHWPNCKQYLLECPNKCGENAIERQHLPKHLEETCPLQVIKCEFSYAGCEVECQRQRMENHLHRNVEVHLNKVSFRTKQQESQISALQRQIDTMMAALIPFIPGPSIEIVMTNFKSHKRVGDSWYSPPIYSHIGGYKMCFRVDANGYGRGEGTHVSLFCCLNRGEYDDQLKWPFRGVITIQLLNQSRDEGHWEETVPFDDRAGDGVAGRVVGRERATGVRGCDFIAHTQLNTENTDYLKNDCLKFRISKFVVEST